MPTKKPASIEYEALTDEDRAQIVGNALLDNERKFYQAQLNLQLATSLGDAEAATKMAEQLTKLSAIHASLVTEKGKLPEVELKPQRMSREDRRAARLAAGGRKGPPEQVN